jgi:hypothetical protein
LVEPLLFRISRTPTPRRGGGDKAKLTKASKEIAKDTRQAIELFMQQKAEEDASKHSE